MKELLKKLKLIENLTTELEIEKSEFVTKFSYCVDEGDIGWFSSPFEMFSSNKNEYKGSVDYDGFKIKRRRRFFDTNLNMAVARGTYRQHNDQLIIETEINGFSGMMIPFYIFVIIFYLIFIVTFFVIGNVEGNGVGLFLPFIILHALFMLGIPYYMMKTSVKRMKHDLEREFYYMTKK